MSEWSKTHRVPGTAVLAAGGSLSGDLHLQPSTELHQSVETPLELLNRPDRFLAMTMDDGGVELVSKDHIKVLEVGGSAPDPVWNPTPGANDLRIEAVLVGGETLSGTVHVQLPPGRARALDFLNLPDRFFALSSGDAAHYLNRAHVLHVRPID
jgi:hypothetical protein